MAERQLTTLLRELREERGESLRAAAQQLGVDPSYLSRLERGEKAPSGQLIQKASKLYAVPAEILELAEGRLPSDVVAIFRRHPELIEKLRADYGSD
jgi:transcriptional regulator with XRE-family HTH domain